MLALKRAIACSSRVRLGKGVEPVISYRSFGGSVVIRQGNESNSNPQEVEGKDNLNEDDPFKESLYQPSSGHQKQDVQLPTEVEEKAASKYLDELLSSEDAFLGDARPSTSSFKHRGEDLLNREWGDNEGFNGEETRGNERRRQERAVMRSFYTREQRKNGAQPYTGQLTPYEATVFTDIFDKVWKTDSATDQKNKGENLFGGFAEKSDDQKMQAFYKRTVDQRTKLKSQQNHQRYGRDEINGREANRLSTRPPSRASKMGIIGELIGPNAVEEEILKELDHALPQISACQTEHELWEWARENVWGVPSKSTIEKRNIIAEIKEKTNSSEEEEETFKQPRFGVMSPTYAPILRILMKQFRERFLSPYSALNVLRIAKNAGPESFVLGCTSIVYAEAVKTAWNVLRDLPLAHQITKEAKDAGVLSSSRRSRSDVRPEFQSSLSMMNSQSDELMDNLHEHSAMSSSVDTIKADVRKSVYQTSKALMTEPESRFSGNPLEQQEESRIGDVFTAKTPTLLLEQFDMIEEMQKFIQPIKPRYNRRERTGSFRTSQSSPRSSSRSSRFSSRPNELFQSSSMY